MWSASCGFSNRKANKGSVGIYPAVRLLCGNGGNNDESCDWVIITR